ncbi:MAG: cytochrome b N-terminal domain-containing protein, partial [Acidobacteria bacterium]|nr:cytochrome b N-terminal domain-containing protein [Acidobacteriota bacterium]
MLIGIWHWFDDRTGLSKTLGPILRHPIPPGVGWEYVLGSATLVSFIIQVVTGTALATIYVSSPDQAYQSLQFITHQAVLGRLLRGMHFFGASAMFMLIAAHWSRVYLTGSYKYPREVSWLSGILLVGCTVLMGYTGQLLRWDQNGVWSTVIAAEQAGRVPWIGNWLARFTIGGNTIGGTTLSRFFAIHVFFIPALLMGLLVLHLYLVVHNGISEPARPGHVVDPKTYRSWYENLLKRSGQPFWPDVAWRDVVVGVFLVALIAALAYVFGPPELGKPPDPTIVPAEPRPDWYLLWYYAVLAVIH